jgi:hypothetical protein
MIGAEILNFVGFFGGEDDSVGSYDLPDGIIAIRVLDHADINRMVIAMNRTQILNSQAALSTAIAAVLAGLRLGVN